MKPAPIAYERAGSLDAALARLDADAETIKVLAGGQSLIPLLNLRLARPEAVLDIAAVRELAYVRADGELRIGALTTLSELEADSDAARLQPLAAEAIPHIAHRAIRNRGTVGGTIAHADPAAELPLVLTVLDGRVAARSLGGEREVSAAEFFQGFLTTALEPNELIESVILPAAGAGDSYAFEEFARRPGDFALASAACAATRSDDGSLTGLRVAIGSVSMTPMLLEGLDAVVPGATSQDSADAAAKVAELAAAAVDPRGDIHGSARYRRHLASALVRKAVERALRSEQAEIGGNGGAG